MVKTAYTVFNWVGGGSFGYMDPPEDPEPMEVNQFDNLSDAFICIDSIEKANCFSDWGLAQWEAAQAEPEIEIGCRECGGESYGCLYCDECAKKQKCPHGRALDDCCACDYAADIAITASKERF